MQRWYSDRPIGFLIPLAGIFALVSGVRRWCYRHGIFRVVKPPVPVIVAGNITVGGSGKTPFVIWLANILSDMGYHPGIITRGYGGKSTHWPLMVTSQSDPLLAGDEAVLLASRTQAPVCAAPDRVRAADCLLRHNNVNVIIGDDGLQHYRLGRDLSIIMLDGMRWLGNGWRLPAGPLREARGRILGADLVICKKGNATVKNPLLDTALTMHLSLGEAVNLRDGRREPLANFAAQHAHAVAAIGHPQQFFEALERHGLKVDGRALPDHTQLSLADLSFADDRPVLMTEKDAVKCHGMNLPNHWYVPASAEFSQQDAERILHAVRQVLKHAGVEPEDKLS
ncbi:MAG: tetraacyldisaccharide 4'-kinase [Gammaproteobacteria bacterium]|nr:tetraacyldisaccharide 4'-kinase [Gammaproteobacteria bacterium]MDE2346572.1 tetraacyldisaccharide 4'-kinase [Gammaproteobacteria bacterium]